MGFTYRDKMRWIHYDFVVLFLQNCNYIEWNQWIHFNRHGSENVFIYPLLKSGNGIGELVCSTGFGLSDVPNANSSSPIELGNAESASAAIADLRCIFELLGTNLIVVRSLFDEKSMPISDNVLSSSPFNNV